MDVKVEKIENSTFKALLETEMSKMMCVCVSVFSMSLERIRTALHIHTKHIFEGTRCFLSIVLRAQGDSTL